VPNSATNFQSTSTILLCASGRLLRTGRANIGLCDILSSFAPHTKASLNELSKIMGMSGKPEGIDGGDVERFYLEGRSRRLLIIARPTWSTLTAFGSATSCFGVV
jgi:hypothetical protein